MRYQLSQLPNGTRLATFEMPHMQSVALGIWAGVGGRFETKTASGVSHFLEHLMFKGTKRRTAKEITESVEGVGGYLNAFTTEDHTCYYAKAGYKHFGTLCDVLSDMYLNSTLQTQEIEREREVIREEIMMYRDNPAQHAQELLSETMWPRHPLGQPLTGTVDSIAKFTRPISEAFHGEKLQWEDHHCDRGGEFAARGSAGAHGRAHEPGARGHFAAVRARPVPDGGAEGLAGDAGDGADAPSHGVLRVRAVG